MGKGVSNLDSRVSQAALDESHVGAVEASLVRQSFLRESPSEAFAFQNLREGGRQAFAAHMGAKAVAPWDFALQTIVSPRRVLASLWLLFSRCEEGAKGMRVANASLFLVSLAVVGVLDGQQPETTRRVLQGVSRVFVWVLADNRTVRYGIDPDTLADSVVRILQNAGIPAARASVQCPEAFCSILEMKVSVVRDSAGRYEEDVECALFEPVTLARDTSVHVPAQTWWGAGRIHKAFDRTGDEMAEFALTAASADVLFFIGEYQAAHRK